jgi:hypothetical protein
VARKLATKECSRLLVVREPTAGPDGAPVTEDAFTVELAHEQLVTQWPDYRFWLRGTGTSRHSADPSRAADKRALDRLMDAARGWGERGSKDEDLQGGGELTEFERLAQARAGWLSAREREFVARSVEAREQGERERQEQLRTAQQLAETRKRQVWWAGIAAMVLLIATSTAIWQWLKATKATDLAEEQRRAAIEAASVAEEQRKEAVTRRNEALITQSRFLADLAQQQTDKGYAATGILLALEALPKNMIQPDRPYVSEAETALYQAITESREKRIMAGHDGPVWSAVFSADGGRVLTASDDETARVWDLASGKDPIILRHGGLVRSAVFSADGGRVLTASETARVWRNFPTPQALIAAARAVVSTWQLTPEQRKTLLPKRAPVD